MDSEIENAYTLSNKYILGVILQKWAPMYMYNTFSYLVCMSMCHVIAQQK